MLIDFFPFFKQAVCLLFQAFSWAATGCRTCHRTAHHFALHAPKRIMAQKVGSSTITCNTCATAQRVMAWDRCELPQGHLGMALVSTQRCTKLQTPGSVFSPLHALSGLANQRGSRVWLVQKELTKPPWHVKNISTECKLQLAASSFALIKREILIPKDWWQWSWALNL